MAGRRRMMHSNPNFGKPPGRETGEISHAVLENARRTGQLNISNRELIEIPASVWLINDVSTRQKEPISFGDSEGQRWWEEQSLFKLTAASNRIRYIGEPLANLVHLTSLDLYDNEIEMLPVAIGRLENLQYLNVSINRLTSLPETLSQCMSLTTVDCHRNAITLLPESFGDMTNLETLDLSENQLVMLPESFMNLRRLRKLNLRKNQLTSISPAICALTSLHTLDISVNRLPTVPETIGEMSRLEALDLHSNRLSTCPQLANCYDLKELYLSENSIGTLDPSVCHLPSLMTLDLHMNKISELPMAITAMENLSRLDLGNNDLTSLPLEVGNMTQLKTLVVDGNPMRTIRRDIIARGTEALKKYLISRMADPIPHEKQPTVTDRGPGLWGDGDEGDINRHDVERFQIFTLADKDLQEIPGDVWSDIRAIDLKTINLRRNQLTIMPIEITWFHASLTSLDLSVNKLTHIPHEIGMLTRLTHLDVSANRLDELPPTIVKLQELARLDLSFNSFRTIPDVVIQLRMLEHLFIGSNELKDVDVNGILKLSSLHTLDMQNNSIEKLPPELGLCEQLSCLKVEGNCFRIPRPALLAKGTTAILQYLRDRIQD